MFEVIYCTVLLVLCIIFYCLIIYEDRPKYVVHLDDACNVYLRKGRTMYHVLGYDNHYVYILGKHNSKKAIPNCDILALGLLDNEKAGD